MKGIVTEAEPVVERNDKGYWRVKRIDVRVKPTLISSDTDRAGRCVDIFENYCVVTGAVREGIQVNVSVEPQKMSPEGVK